VRLSYPGSVRAEYCGRYLMRSIDGPLVWDNVGKKMSALPRIEPESLHIPVHNFVSTLTEKYQFCMNKCENNTNSKAKKRKPSFYGRPVQLKTDCGLCPIPYVTSWTASYT
jgi:hypothetical protein